MHPARPYRIAYVIGELGKGGAEYQLHELLRHLDRTLFAPEVIVLSEGGYWSEPIRRLGVPLTALPRRGSADLGRLRGRRARLRALAPHVLHTILWPGNTYGRLAAAGLGIPVVIAAERNVILRPRWQMLTERALDRMTDAYLVNSQTIATVLAERERLPRAKIRVIPNGIDLDALPPFTLDRRPGRRAAGLAPDRRVVAQVGRLAPQKDYPTFLAAAAEIAGAAPDVDFLVVGEGAERPALEALVERLGLGGRVRFTGLRHDVPALLAGVDVLALTSTYEGFPNAVMEAMAMGAVPVVTDVGGCRELVVPDETGVIVAPGDPGAVARAVLALLAEPERARRWAAAGRRRLEAEFGVRAMAARTTDAYLSLLRARGTASAVAAA
jgi:glycosyltransferase involved in cell wall biosynthesis